LDLGTTSLRNVRTLTVSQIKYTQIHTQIKDSETIADRTFGGPMKINRISDFFDPLLRAVRKDKDQGSSGYQQHQDQNRKKKNEEIELTDAELQDAVQVFAKDPESLKNGLSASVEGTGPGLRVTLKDGTGVTIRHLTGEEFVKLRIEAGQDQLHRGKLLDRKA
jgi:hypothetical protein